MSAAEDPGSTRPARLVGLVLMGIAAIAVVLGVVTLIDGGDGDNDAAPPPSTPSETTQPGEQPGTNPPPPETQPPTQPPTQPSATSGQPPAPPTAAPPPPPPANPRAVPVRVYNNGTVSGLARQAANDFTADGWNITEVGNYSQGIIPTSTVYFRPGTEEEAGARELGRKFNLRVEPRFQGIADTPAGLIVLLANDYGGK